MSTICHDDYSLLEAEGWEIGSRWSALCTQGFTFATLNTPVIGLESPTRHAKTTRYGMPRGDFRFTGRDVPQRNRSVLG